MWKVLVWPAILLFLTNTSRLYFQYGTYCEINTVLSSLCVNLAVFGYAFGKISFILYGIFLLVYAVLLSARRKKINYWVFVFLGPLSLLMAIALELLFLFTGSLPPVLLWIIGQP